MMCSAKNLRALILLLFTTLALCFRAQTAYVYTVTQTVDECDPAIAVLDITGTTAADSVSIDWSNGYTDTKVLNGLRAGDYSVHIKIKHKTDSVPLVKDTTLFFRILKEECIVSIGKYFSPNGDNYNDLLGINNIEKYPDFELDIFNKWGQRVHHQRSTYTPWDGTWLGADLPDGVYYYVFFHNAANRSKLIKGDITILR